MQYVVHIGVNKTGSSSLQSAFYDNRRALSGLGIVYPDIGTEMGAHHHLSRALKGVRPAELGLADTWPETFAAAMQGFQTCVLSSEDFATIHDPSRLTALCPPGRTRIVIYVREHVAHTISWYQQVISMKNTALTLREFAEFSVMNYCDLHDRWAAVYGAENVLLRHYDRAHLRNGDVVADFAEIVAPGLENALLQRGRDLNASVSGNLLFLKRVLNCFLTFPEARAIMHEAEAMTTLAPSFRGKMAVDSETVTRIRHLSRGDRTRLAERHGIHLVPPMGEIAGWPCPDPERLAADFAQIRDHAARSKPGFAAMLDRLIGMVTPLPSSSLSLERTSDMAEPAADPKKTLELDVARALFAARNPGLADEAARKEGWLAQKEQCRKEARVVLRRLDLAGYSITKG